MNDCTECDTLCVFEGDLLHLYLLYTCMHFIAVSGREDLDFVPMLLADAAQRDRLVQRAHLPDVIIDQYEREYVCVCVCVCVCVHELCVLSLSLSLCIFRFFPPLSSLNHTPTGLQVNAAQGVFPEISRAWFTIDSSIYLWDYEDG